MLNYKAPAGVAKLVDAQDLKSWGSKDPCRFDSGPRHQKQKGLAIAQVPFVLPGGQNRSEHFSKRNASCISGPRHQNFQAQH